MEYRRTGRSGLKLPAVSLGLWHNFGDDRTLESQRAILRRAFDLGVTHFDLANNYGPPPGSAELNFGKLFAQDFRPVPRRAGHLHQGRLPDAPRPVRRVGLAASTCCPRWTPRCSGWASTTSTSSTPTASTRTPRSRRRWARSPPPSSRARRCTRASPPTTREQTAEAARLLREMGVPALIHQPSYSMINRWTEDDGLLDTLEDGGHGLHLLRAARPGPAHRTSTCRASRRARAPRRASRWTRTC